MRVVPSGVEPVTQRKAEIVLVQFDQRGAEFRSETQRLCKAIRLKLKMSTQDR